MKNVGAEYIDGGRDSQKPVQKAESCPELAVKITLSRAQQYGPD